MSREGTSFANTRWSRGHNILRHISAVKFGRMSKKQREKVEDEVRMHKQLQEQHPLTNPSQVVVANGCSSYGQFSQFSGNSSQYSPASLYSSYHSSGQYLSPNGFANGYGAYMTSPSMNYQSHLMPSSPYPSTTTTTIVPYSSSTPDPHRVKMEQLQDQQTLG
ncbi:unnamed protein product [Soboliphyme baturini]|uniref:Transcription factor SOX-15 n=1 Tax=Soboliphyme baturini TaxID=241478 RepID=A0A183I921_9BILA|nr:unnamed protein product [Soboliphyme baturini]